MGFIGKINRILEVIPKKRQNLLFSATMSDKVEILVGDFLLFPTKVEVSLQATPAKNVEQRVYMVPNLKSKINLLYHFLLDEETFQKVIVFCKTKTIADNVYHYISRKFGEDQVKVIHANKGQNTRINSMEAFKEGSVRVLVGTDVASRGIDVTEVTHVINFDVPLIYEDYVHRIGRTGRAEKLGVSITFSNESETLHLAKIEKLIRQKIPVLPIPEGVIFAETSFNEKQAIAREIDEHKRREDPTFKGSFHEKKFKRPSADEKKKLAKQKEQQLNKGNAKSKSKSSTDDKTKNTPRKKGKNWDKKIK
jgi:ATP-dependent RNA helicase RhlE